MELILAEELVRVVGNGALNTTVVLVEIGRVRAGYALTEKNLSDAKKNLRHSANSVKNAVGD
ncbi:hypothetical protein FACS189449_03920 [Alphaproteobacteria bacterium]|nr:hypothetical protein FACS189449_03920 [Alphaproteobacteria bacterium]